MKLTVIYLTLLILGGCTKLNLNPLAEPSTSTFYSNQPELELAINDLYRIQYWYNDNPEYGDSYWSRGALGNPITFGTLNADDPNVLNFWKNNYSQIAKVNTYISNMNRAKTNTPPDIFLRLEAEARFVRAYSYSTLITHFGDVPFITQPISLDSSYKLRRTDKKVILKFIFDELDWAADNLPKTYSSGDLQRFTKGAALAVKARTALYMGEWSVAETASKAIMDLAIQGTYSLYPNYRNLFLNIGNNCNEIILGFPRSQNLGVYISGFPIQQNLNRLNGGTAALIPTWEIVDSYECTDGLPIDKSPLYDPHDPFANRDPRMAMSIVPFGTNWLGFSYQPHPDSLLARNYNTGALVSNNDSRAVNIYASWTGFLWKKEVDQSWVDKKISDRQLIIIRYAEILLTYAEAKIELNEIDQSVLDAINQVRARAYGVGISQTSAYPAITTLDQDQLRTIIKRERRVEFTKEGLRYMDLIRWHIAEKALSKPVLGFPDPANQDRSKWPFSGAPVIDKDGIPDYSNLISNIKILAQRNFDKSKQYLWPIPYADRLLNPDLSQNNGY
jgi:hypothetical protein